MKDSDPFTQKIKQQLDSIPLDDDGKRQLDLARKVAINSSYSEPVKSWRRFASSPALAFASVAALAFVMILLLGPPSSVAPSEQVANFEILTAQDDFEMYRDMDFYLWLDNEQMDVPAS